MKKPWPNNGKNIALIVEASTGKFRAGVSHRLQKDNRASQVTTEIEVILFDLGGVLIELGESPFNSDWLEPGNQEAINNWHLSSANVGFDKGLISAQSFARTFKADLNLNASPQQIIDHFRNWPIGPYQGVSDLLQSLKSRFRLAILTNTNALHWPRIVDEFDLIGQVEQVFASHQLGMIKPETEIFHHVLAQLEVAPQRVLFLDDNQKNIDTAQQLGMQGLQVKGFEDLLAGLKTMGVGYY